MRVCPRFCKSEISPKIEDFVPARSLSFRNEDGAKKFRIGSVADHPAQQYGGGGLDYTPTD